MYLIDYFSFTIRFEKITFDYVLNLLKLQNFKHLFIDVGARDRYEHCFKFGQIEIMLPYAKREDMGIFINLTGQGCREYEDCFKNLYGDNFDWKYLIKRLVNEVNNSHKVNITRLDLAFDDFDGLLKMKKIKKKLDMGEYVSRFKKWNEVQTNKTHTKKELVGETYYVGTKQSQCYCKFYDKLLEQKLKNKNDEFVMKQLESMQHWVRFEITFKDKIAIFVCNMICYSTDVNKDIREYINSCFRFVDLTKSNISRCPITNFWEQFIQSADVSKYRLIQSNLHGYDKTYKWFTSALAPSLFALMSTYKNRNDFIRDIVYHGAFRLNENHKQIMEFENTGIKLSNQQLWSYNNPYEGIYTYDMEHNDDLELFDYKGFKY
ncbi:replication initiation factor domain-containing protein [Paludicola sp. MB14-C6]|uniref:replication initiation factor domain-containing protein n=1 Tax=Paludihabitans sp. MB14-C6 TaxID=3070656 RepID=UPI0027DC4F86|nr:replication initiation factor domain-containing protein [Paludicola sp. MB14-C6]WMJ23351.1 replication initiation factor domain-containing protein [Paludicola sp. MB14-C6]